MNMPDIGTLGAPGGDLIMLLLPLWILLGAVVLLMCVDMASRRNDGRDSGIALGPAVWISALGAAGAALSCLMVYVRCDRDTLSAGELFYVIGPRNGYEDAPSWWGAALSIDTFGLLAALALCIVLFFSVLSLSAFLHKRGLHRPELFPLLLLSALGMLLLVFSRDLLLSFAAIELLSLPLYVLCGLNARDSLGRESSLKYFLLGAFASGFLIYGAALVYGFAGSLNYVVLTQVIGHYAGGSSGILVAGLALIAVGLAFKLGLVPFHAWLPDVYQGAPTPLTGFMAAGVKLAVAAAFIRLITECVVTLPSGEWKTALLVFAALSMLGGNLLALHQMSAKRMLACSAIAHSGYLALALAAASTPAARSLLFYLFAYGIAALGVFALISYLAPDGQDDVFLDQLHELHQQAPLSSIALAVLLLSLGGFPLTAGFIGKLLVFRDAWAAGLTGMVIFALLNSVVSFYYYLRFVMAMYMQPRTPGGSRLTLERMPGAYAATAIVSVVLTIAFGLMPDGLIRATDNCRLLPKKLGNWKPIAADVAGKDSPAGS